MMELEPIPPSVSSNPKWARVSKACLTGIGAAKTGSSRLALGLGAGVLFATFTAVAFAYPISEASFSQLASSCAPGVAVSTLRAVASVESHFDPLAIRDNTTHESWAPSSISAAGVLAKDRLKRGHSIDIGLMQINSRNLASLGMGVEDAFNACHSLDAAHRILQTAFTAGSSESERQAAILITLSRYNTGKTLAGIANGYANQVISTESAPLLGTLAHEKAPNISPQWNIWGTSSAEPASWVVTTDASSEIERAGAQSTDARAKVRAAVPPLEKGEPYELYAYQKTEPSQP